MLGLEDWFFHFLVERCLDLTLLSALRVSKSQATDFFVFNLQFYKIFGIHRPKKCYDWTTTMEEVFVNSFLCFNFNSLMLQSTSREFLFYFIFVMACDLSFLFIFYFFSYKKICFLLCSSLLLRWFQCFCRCSARIKEVFPLLSSYKARFVNQQTSLVLSRPCLLLPCFFPFQIMILASIGIFNSRISFFVVCRTFHSRRHPFLCLNTSSKSSFLSLHITLKAPEPSSLIYVLLLLFFFHPNLRL